ncbi:hypothetical protein D3C87_1255870 [compost metagenome]
MLDDDPTQRGQTVHNRHLDIQQHHVQRVLPKLPQGRFTVRGRGRDLELPIGLQETPNDAAHDGGVVNNHDLNRL